MNNTSEYKMSQLMFDEIYKTCKNKKIDPQEYVCKIVNEEFGIKTTVVKVLTD